MIRSVHSPYCAAGAAAGQAGNEGLRAGEMETQQSSLVAQAKGGSAGTPRCAHEAGAGVAWAWWSGKLARGWWDIQAQTHEDVAP